MLAALAAALRVSDGKPPHMLKKMGTFCLVEIIMGKAFGAKGSDEYFKRSR